MSIIKGIGDIKLRMHDGLEKILKSVRYVPDLKRNLISLGELDKSGHSYKGHGGVLRVLKRSLICMKTAFHNGIYVLEATTLSGEAAIGENKTYDQTKLWHYRMAHISEQGLRELSKQGILGVENVTELGQCETCIFGKSSKV